MTDQEKIIELTDIVSDNAQGQEKIIELTDIVPDAPPVEENIIELTDTVEEAPAAATEPAADQAEEAFSSENLLQDAAPFGDDTGGTDLESALIFDDELEDAFNEESAQEDDFASNLGMEIEDETEDDAQEDFEETPVAEEPMADAPVDSFAQQEPAEAAAEPFEEAAPISVSDERIEAAVAKIMEEKFSQRIELLMVDAVEKAVEKELAKIKAILLGTDGDSSND